MADNQFDVVILGGGSGGYACALRSAELGLSVALIEKDKLGGTCLHRGCIPTKALLHAAEVADTARESEQFGVSTTLNGIDIGKVNSYRDGVVGRLYKGLQGLVKSRAITYVEGSGRLTSANTVEVDGTAYTGRNVVLATGSYARSLPGLDIGGRVMTSDQALQLDYIPASVIVLGGGVIGVEFASVWRSFGSQVTIIEALPRLVPAEDEACSKALERAFRKRKIAFTTGVRFAGVTQDDTGVVATLEDGTTHSAEIMLVAVGRGPNASGMGFEEVGVAMDRGWVLADERLRDQHPRRLRGRRHRARAAAGAPRVPAGHLRRRGDRRAQPAGDRRARYPAGDLLRARDRLDRADRGPGQGEVRRRRRRVLRVQPRRATARARSWRPRASSSWSDASTDPWSASTWSAPGSASRSARPS